MGQANELYDEVLRLEPSNFDAMIKKSRALINLHKFEEAKRLYERAFNSGGKHPIKLSLIATAYARVEKHDEAQLLIKEALELGKYSIPILYNAACVYSLLYCKEQALHYLEEVIKQDRGYYKKKTLSDEDLSGIREEERFIELVG